MPGTQIQGQSQGVQQPQQNFANQQTQPTSTLQGNIQSVQSGQGQGQMYVEHLDFDLEFVSQAFVMLAGCNLLRQTSANKYDNNYRNGL
jgi:hypothetical protein